MSMYGHPVDPKHPGQPGNGICLWWGLMVLMPSLGSPTVARLQVAAAAAAPQGWEIPSVGDSGRRPRQGGAREHHENE